VTKSPIPHDLPRRLTLSLWDYSWYTRAAPGDRFGDLERCFREAVERGYNTIRICAMPFLLFGDHDLPDRHELHITGMGNGFGAGSRWYDGAAPASFDPLSRLGLLFDLARDYDCYVILSSWEYQQSPSFSATPAWYEALYAVPNGRRLHALAASLCRMLDWLKSTGRFDRVAYVELHNEVENSRLWDISPLDRSKRHLVRDETEDAIGIVRAAHPDTMVTVSYVISYAQPLEHPLQGCARNVQVGHVHIYPDSVVGALIREVLSYELWIDDPEKGAGSGFPNATLRSLLRPDAPPADEHLPDGLWRLDANGIPQKLFYFFDWTDPAKVDEWFLSHHGEFAEKTRAELTRAIEQTAEWSKELDVPAVLGEGYLWSPLRSTFERSAIGRGIFEHVVNESVRCGLWGTTLTCTGAPTHPEWSDLAWQCTLNKTFLAG